ncbi:hypothetical protein GCM10020000_59110 [Streptomyces olivoverticillatus]
MCCLAALLLTLQALAGCGPTASSGRPDAAAQSVQKLLDGWAAALRGRDERAYLGAVDPAATDYQNARGQVFANLAAVPLASWDYRIVSTTGLRPTPGEGDRATAQAELRYRLAGYDTAPVTAPRPADAGVAGRPLVRGRRGHLRQRQPAVGAGRRHRGAGRAQPRPRHRAGPGAAAGDGGPGRPGGASGERGVAARHVGGPGGRRDARLAGADGGALLGSPAANYRGIAAVTTGEVGGAGAAPADRIIVNPEAYGTLGEFGRRIVLTHETAHVATRALTSAATPLWLSEGFADWAAYRGTGRTARQAAPELAQAVSAGRLPAALPEDPDFGFAGEPGRLARAYEEGWLACRMIAEKWGEAKLVAFYRAVGGHKKRPGAVEAALQQVLGIGQADFTARWRTYLTEAFSD